MSEFFSQGCAFLSQKLSPVANFISTSLDAIAQTGPEAKVGAFAVEVLINRKVSSFIATNLSSLISKSLPVKWLKIEATEQNNKKENTADNVDNKDETTDRVGKDKVEKEGDDDERDASRTGGTVDSDKVKNGEDADKEKDKEEPVDGKNNQPKSILDAAQIKVAQKNWAASIERFAFAVSAAAFNYFFLKRIGLDQRFCAPIAITTGLTMTMLEAALKKEAAPKETTTKV